MTGGKGNEKQNGSLLDLMYGIVFLSVLLISAFVWISTLGVLARYEAREFLGSVRYIPVSPLHTLIRLSADMLLLGVTYLFRKSSMNRRDWAIILSLLCDFAIAFRVILLLDFNYNGVLLWVFANVLLFLYTGKRRFFLPVIVIGVLSYLLTTHGISSIYSSLYSVEDYIRLYPSHLQPYLFGAYTMLTVFSILSFIGCCLLIIANKEEKLEETHQLYEKLAEANENLKLANAELEEVMEENTKMAEVRERNRIAREIHDTMGHTLTGLAAGIDACIALTDSAPGAVKEQLRLLSEVSRKGIADVRHSVSELRPDALERLHLEAAVRQLVEDTVKMTGARVTFLCNAGVLKFDEDEESAIYRVIQESITNAIRHGHATEIEARIDRTDNELHLCVSDNGCGVPDGQMKEGFGTRHIKERIRMLNGTVQFKNGNGFTVEAVIPIRWGEEYD